jgi:hypothetical protein
MFNYTFLDFFEVSEHPIYLHFNLTFLAFFFQVSKNFSSISLLYDHLIISKQEFVLYLPCIYISIPEIPPP